MSKSITLRDIEKHLECFSLIYDNMRIVDPEHKKVLTYYKNALKETDEECYSCWKRNQMCDNCISVRAYHEKKSVFKLETNSNSIIMITALPIENADIPLVLELIKDVTESLILDHDNDLGNRNISDSISQLNDMVIKDHLTSVYNRYFIDDRLPVNITNAVLKKSPLSVIFIDVDDFKSINDTYGHGIGDVALKAIADAVSSCIRTNDDWVARYGGDEFLACLNDTDAEAARTVAERILGSISSISIPVEGVCIGITISVGIYTMLDKALAAAEIIKLADQNMYKSKFNGKNRITSSAG